MDKLTKILLGIFICVSANAAEHIDLGYGQHIINISAANNGPDNPIAFYLLKGKYRIYHVGPNQFPEAEYVASNNRGGELVNCSVYGYCSQGWGRSYYFNGYDVYAEPTIDSGQFGYTLLCQTEVGQWITPEQALMEQRARAVVCDFETRINGYVFVHKPDAQDYDYTNNLGGVSLLIRPTDPICLDYNNGWSHQGDYVCAPGKSGEKNNAGNSDRTNPIKK